MKKIISIILVVVMILLSVITSTAVTKPEEFIYGDVDMDGVVTVKDATAIQKGLAELEYLTAVQRYLADPNGEGVTVKSATAIQKHIAGLGGGSSIDEVVEMDNSNKFSEKLSMESNFEGKYIIITPQNIDYNYTLEDFPEHSFDRIEVIGSKEKGYVFYRLYLNESGKENLLEVIKALDYRANIDLNDVSPDGYFLPM